MDRRAGFTLFVVSTNGVIHREAEHFLKRRAGRLADNWADAIQSGDVL